MNKTKAAAIPGGNGLAQHHYVVIMAGGIGSRFWPMSRSNFPKQFLDILNIGKTLIQTTYDRFAGFILPENIYVVTSNEYVNIVKKQLPQIPLQNILGEPSRKNTAPCIAYISFKLQLVPLIREQQLYLLNNKSLSLYLCR